MSYFADLSPCTYSSGPYDAASWRCPFLAIGWLEHPNEFPKGGQLVESVRDRIAFLRFAFEEVYAGIIFRGLHTCSWCFSQGVDEWGAMLRDSEINLFIPDTARVFIAPGRIDHYVEEHGYLPPNEFLEALMRCPDPRTGQYEAALRGANGGVDSPLAEAREDWFSRAADRARQRGRGSS